jgi:hypothetical protein
MSAVPQRFSSSCFLPSINPTIYQPRSDEKDRSSLVAQRAGFLRRWHRTVEDMVYSWERGAHHAGDIEVAAFAALHLIVIDHDALALLPSGLCSAAAGSLHSRDRVKEDP